MKTSRMELQLSEFYSLSEREFHSDGKLSLRYNYKIKDIECSCLPVAYIIVYFLTHILYIDLMHAYLRIYCLRVHIL